MLIASKPNIEIVEAGLYTAVCTGVIDQGLQVNEQFNKSAPSVRLIFELVGETYEYNDEEHTRQVGRDFTLSLGEKSNLRGFLQSWRGKSFSSDELNGFDLKTILGKAGQLQIIHRESKSSGNPYAYVNNMVPLPKGMAAPKPENRLVYFDMDDKDTYGEYELFPDFLKDRIAAAENFEATGLGVTLDDDEDEKPAAKPAAAPKAAPKAAAQPVAPAATAKPAPAEEISPDDDLSFEITGEAA